MISWRMLTVTFATRMIFSLVGAVLLLAMADLAEMSRQLPGQENPLGLVLAVYGNLALSLALQALPIAVLLGILLSITDLARSGELLALRASGAGSLRLASPALLLALALAACGMLVADSLAPRGVKKATIIQMETLGRMRSAWSHFHVEHKWFAADGGGLYNVEEVDEEGRRLTGLWRYEHDGGRLTSVAHAGELAHDGLGWTGTSTIAWTFDPKDPTVLGVDDKLSVPEEPAHFAGVAAHPEALTRLELRKAMELRRAQGQPIVPFALEAQARWTMPLLGLGLALLALGLGLARPPGTHVEAAAKAIAVAFAAWTLLSICRAMGLSGMISPGLAAFLPVILPAAVGAGLLVRGR